jgi:hypothetical protein
VVDSGTTATQPTESKDLLTATALNKDKAEFAPKDKIKKTEE